MRHRANIPLLFIIAILLGTVVVLINRDSPNTVPSEDRGNLENDGALPRTSKVTSSGNQDTSGFGGSGESGAGQAVQVENDSERVYGEIYTEHVSCEDVTQGFAALDTVYGYCKWPYGLPDRASCIENGTDYLSGGVQNYLCKPAFGSKSGTHPDEVTLVNAPEEIYTIEVHCENVTEQFGTIYGDCDWPLFGSRSNDCIEVDSRDMFGSGKDYLCKP